MVVFVVKEDNMNGTFDDPTPLACESWTEEQWEDHRAKVRGEHGTRDYTLADIMLGVGDSVARWAWSDPAANR